MQRIQSITDLRESLSRLQPQVLGLVPTLGALHAGHLSLIQRCRQDCDGVVVSMFVNPLQFGPQEDFDRYPRTLDHDQQVCEAAGVDLIFAPDQHEVFPHNGQFDPELITRVIPPAAMLGHLCGPFRPGHFEGVTTIVMKLFQIVQPQRAYFGEKDAQQLALIKRIVHDLNVPVTIVACPTVREVDGLALSSRNRYLSDQERSIAVCLFQGLQQARSQFDQGERSTAKLIQVVNDRLQPHSASVKVQYVELVDPETLQPLETIETQGLLAIAAVIGKTRLIDNMLLQVAQVLPSDLKDLQIQGPETSFDPGLTPPEPLLARRPLIAIDGPAGAGKSTVARQVAAALNLLYLDTGAMYRAVTWLALEHGIDLNDQERLTRLAQEINLRLSSDVPTGSPVRVWVNDHEVTLQIRSGRVTERVSRVAAIAGVRQALVEQQRAIGRQGGAVLEGRDIGTYVFPDAELKIFLTASVEERVQRRHSELKAQGQPVDLADLEEQIQRRDRYDSERAIAPLRPAPDAIEIKTDNLTPAEVQARIVDLYHQLP